MVNIKG